MGVPDSPGFFVVGYAASRRLERPEGVSEITRSPRYQRVAGLFEDYVGLLPFEYGTWSCKVADFLTAARTLLNHLLPDGVKLTANVDSSNHPLFDRAGIFSSRSPLSPMGFAPTSAGSGT